MNLELLPVYENPQSILFVQNQPKSLYQSLLDHTGKKQKNRIGEDTARLNRRTAKLNKVLHKCIYAGVFKIVVSMKNFFLHAFAF